MSALFFNDLVAASPSRLVNAWRVRSGNSRYLVTPAHVALFVKGHRYVRSPFLDELKDLNWKVPRLYVDGSILFDLAWAEVGDDGQHSLRVREAPVESTLSTTMYFRQPYDADAKWDGPRSVIGAIPGIVYPSMSSPLLEVLDVGFRGMSGAIAIDTSQLEPEVLGIMSRRAKPIQLKLDRPVDGTAFDPEHDFLNVAGDVDPAPGLVSDPQMTTVLSKSESVLLREMRTLGQAVNVLGQSVQSQGRSMQSQGRSMQSLERAVRSLEKKVLTIDDVDRILYVVSMRRAMILPWSHMNKLMQDAVDLSSLVGKVAD